MIDNLWIALALLSQRKRGTKISGLFLFSCQSLQRLDLFLKADVKSRDYRIVIHLLNVFLLTKISIPIFSMILLKKSQKLIFTIFKLVHFFNSIDSKVEKI